MLVAFDAVAIWYVTRYAVKVRRDPSRSLVADISFRHGGEERKGGEPPALTGRRKAVLVVFTLTFLVMIYAVIPFDDMGLPIPALGWWFPELSGLFLLAGILAGLIYGMGEAGDRGGLRGRSPRTSSAWPSSSASAGASPC